MKQVININFHGRVVPIEVTAYDFLKKYIDTLHQHFINEEGKEEIINDIEGRIGELFQQALQKGATCITDADVNAVINSMGRPEDFDDTPTASAKPEEKIQSTQPKKLYRDENNKIIGGVCSGLANYMGVDVVVVRIFFVLLVISFGFGLLPYLVLWIATPSSANKEIGATRKKLFRDTEDNIVGGVCSGIGHYFGINPWIPRLIFTLPLLGTFSRWEFAIQFSPSALLAYVLCWLIIPEAKSTSEKLEMKGEKIDLQSIKNIVTEEAKSIQEKAKLMAEELKQSASTNTRSFFHQSTSFAKSIVQALVKALLFLIKIFSYTLLAIAVIVLLALLFAFSISAFAIFPLKEFVLESGWQNTFAWGVLLFFVLVPLIGIITWIIRKVAKIKSGRTPLRVAFISLWILGWVSVVGLLMSVANQFSYNNIPQPSNISLQHPTAQKLSIVFNSSSNNIIEPNRISFSPFNILKNDTLYIQNVSVEIEKSNNDSFYVTIQKMASGPSRAKATTTAEAISYRFTQKDSTLFLDKAIAITQLKKFRNQHIIVTVFVPVGKQIKIKNQNPTKWRLRFSDHGMEFSNEREGNNNHRWQNDIDYIMQPSGLYSTDGKPIQLDTNGNDLSPGTSQQKRDSLQQLHQSIEKQLEDLEEPNTDPTASVLYNPMFFL